VKNAQDVVYLWYNSHRYPNENISGKLGRRESRTALEKIERGEIERGKVKGKKDQKTNPISHLCQALGKRFLYWISSPSLKVWIHSAIFSVTCLAMVLQHKLHGTSLSNWPCNPKFFVRPVAAVVAKSRIHLNK
jgi:hypothetical protein